MVAVVDGGWDVVVVVVGEAVVSGGASPADVHAASPSEKAVTAMAIFRKPIAAKA